MQTITLQNGKQLTIEDDDSRDDIIKAVKIMDPEGSYKEFLDAYGELKAEEEYEQHGGGVGDQINLLSQGATFGFEDEITSGIRGLGAALVPGGDTFSDAYDKTMAERGAYLDKVKDNTSKANQLAAEWGIPTGIAGKLIYKGVTKGIEKLVKRKAKPGEVKSYIKGQLEDQGLSPDKAEKVAQKALMSGPYGLAATKAAENAVSKPTGITSLLSKSAVPAATIGGSPIVAGGITGAGKADPGERLEGAIAGAKVGKNFVASIPRGPVSTLLSATPVYAEGGEVFDNKVRKIYKEGYTAPGQAYAIAKSYQKKGLLG